MPPRRTCYNKGDFHFVDVHVGARLRRRRQLLGISQTQLGNAAGVSFPLIQKYETAKTRISPSRLCAFARALAVEVGWFFDGLLPTSSGQAGISVPARQPESPETASLVEDYLRIAPGRRRAVLRLIRSIAGTPQIKMLSPRRVRIHTCAGGCSSIAAVKMITRSFSAVMSRCIASMLR
jgi:transcriptional regulator with XRE-family HTH domain